MVLGVIIGDLADTVGQQTGVDQGVSGVDTRAYVEHWRMAGFAGAERLFGGRVEFEGWIGNDLFHYSASKLVLENCPYFLSHRKRVAAMGGVRNRPTWKSGQAKACPRTAAMKQAWCEVGGWVSHAQSPNLR